MKLNMRKFATIMSITGICVNLLTCVIFVCATRGIIQIDRTHIQSIVFCTLAIALYCFVPSKLVVYQEAKEIDDNVEAQVKARNAVILNIAAGTMLIVLSVWKYLRT